MKVPEKHIITVLWPNFKLQGGLFGNKQTTPFGTATTSSGFGFGTATSSTGGLFANKMPATGGGLFGGNASTGTAFGKDIIYIKYIG